MGDSCIYAIKNKVNGKTYIGQTVDYRQRKRNHKTRLKSGIHHNEMLQRAWKKYGESAFSFEIIEHCPLSELDEKEVMYINQHGSMAEQGGYNLVTGGVKYRVYSIAVREKMSQKSKGRKFTADHKKKIGLANMGRKLSPESIEQIKKTKKERQSQWGGKNPNAAITDELAKEIILDMVAGATVAEVMDRHCITEHIAYSLKSNKSYSHVLPEIRGQLKDVYKNKKKYEQVVALYLGGMSQSTIAQKLKISRNTIREMLVGQGIDTKIHVNQFVRAQ